MTFAASLQLQLIFSHIMAYATLFYRNHNTIQQAFLQISFYQLEIWIPTVAWVNLDEHT